MQLTDPFVVPNLKAGPLELRGYGSVDAEWVADLAAPFEVVRFTGLPHPMSRPAAEAWVQRFVDGAKACTTLGWGAHLGGDPVGSGSLRLRPEEGIARLGFWLSKDCWGCGYGRRIAQALTNFAFQALGARRLEADCISDNVASAKILQSCGFREEGRLRGGFARFGTVHDVTVFGALRSECAPGGPGSSHP